jgi:hypothetical protein
MHRRGGAREVEDLVDLHVQGKGNVVTKQFHAGVIEQMRNVVPCAGKEIVDTEDFVASFQKPLAEM